MRFFDLHCDTLYKAATQNKSLDEASFEISYTKVDKCFDIWKECTAVWIPDGLNIIEMRSLFNKCCNLLSNEAKRFNINVNCSDLHKSSFLLTVENGALLGDDINYIEHLKEMGVKMLTLTWNAENCIGGGADAQNAGLKPFGLECIKSLEKNRIIIDISHASDKLFWDVADNSHRPFVASHSNSRKLCNHRRNLTDEQFKVISERQGLVGLNFHRDFLKENGYEASTIDVINHAYHFLSLGGEDVLVIGSDFDGADMPSDLDSIERIPVLAEEFIKAGFNEQIVQKIMYDNAHNFFSKF